MASERWRRAAILVALGMVARPVAAQCPDGSLATLCARPAAPRPLDANRIAILPFRTSGADPALGHLGNGLMELLSAEFSGEVGPAAVEPGEALLAWNRAGADREAATTTAAIRVARALGAGQVAVGSVVGTSARFSVAVSILNVADGSVRVSRVQVEGTEDSLPALTASLSTQLLGKAAGISGTTNNEALRAYIAGMADYRKSAGLCASGNCDAEGHFLRATKLDSTFILPAFRLVLLRALFGPTQGVDAFRASFRALWNHRNKLSAEQRLLVEALADSNNMLFRMQALPRMERVAPSLPNIAEAWDILGDLEFHVGALIGREDWAERSRLAFQKAVELDAKLCACSFEHLADFAYLEGDARTFSKYGSLTPWQRYQGAILSSNPASIRLARILYTRDAAVASDGPGLISGVFPYWLTGIPLPNREADSVLTLLESLANNEQQRRALAQWTMIWSHFAGRPNHAAEAARRFAGADTAQYYLTNLEYVHDDSAAAERLLPMLDRSSRNDGTRACEVALARLRRADTAGVTTILNQLDPAKHDLAEILAGPRPSIPLICAQVLRGVLASLGPSGGPLLHRADSLMRFMPRNAGDHWNYDLGLAFARRGEFAMAASAVRRHAQAIGRWAVPRLVISLRQEGRWAALAGDTAAAIRAYRQYLAYRENPEPALVPERDSVRTELVTLEKAYRKSQAPKRPTLQE